MLIFLRIDNGIVSNAVIIYICVLFWQLNIRESGTVNRSPQLSARTESHFASSNQHGLSMGAPSHLPGIYLPSCLFATKPEVFGVSKALVAIWCSPEMHQNSVFSGPTLPSYNRFLSYNRFQITFLKAFLMKGLLFSQAETGSPSFLLSAPSLFLYHHSATTHKIHDIYHDSSHPFTWQLEMPSGWAGGLIFVFVFLSFSISVTLRYHWYSQKSALTWHDRHIHIAKAHDLNRPKRSLSLKSRLCEEAPPPIFSAQLPYYNQLHLPPGKVCQHLLPLGRMMSVWDTNETCCFFASGQLRPDPACSNTRSNCCLWKHILTPLLNKQW